MSSAGPWSVKGIDARAREIAKDQARRSGQTLGEWLNARIIEDVISAPAPALGRAPAGAPAALAAGSGGDLKGLARALEALSARMETAEKRSADAMSGVDRKLAGVLKRMDGGDVEAGRKLEEVRATQAELAERLGRAGPDDQPRREALKALEQALGKVAAQIYEGESRARAQTAELRGDLAALSTRVDATEARASTPPTTSEGVAMEEVERRFADMSARLEAAEARTSQAMRALEGSFAGLDRRIADVETRPPQEGVSEQRFERLAAELHDRVETARADMAERIRAAAGGGLERMEEALRELAGDVARAEKRQVGAIDTMGREVVRIAQSLNTRLGAAEGRQDEGERRVGAEVARMADIVETRLREGDEQQAQALERLGGEIARIAETLAERIGASERRSAQTAEDAFEHLRDVSERLNARHEATTAEVDARIRSAEERAAHLLETPPPTSTVDPAEVLAAVSATHPHLTPSWEPPAPAPSPFVSNEDAAATRAAAEAPPAVDPRPVPPPYDPFAGFEAEPEPLAESFAPPPEPFAPVAPPPADPFSAITRDEAPIDRFAAAEPVDDIFDAPPPSAPARASTRELIEQARASAREAAEARGGRKGKLLELHGSTAASTVGGLSNLPWLKKREASGATRTAVVASLVASSTVALAVGAASLAHSDHTPATTGEAPTAVAQANSAATDGQLAVALTAPDPSIDVGGNLHGAAVTNPATFASSSDAGVALPAATPSRASVATDGVAAQADAPGAAAKLAFGDALRRIEAGDATGVTALKRAANLGYPPAQLKLASLYEQGAAGLPKDVAQSRIWTQRAAVNGDSHAQFNLGMFYANGDGGLKNDSSAANWFRRAADGGLHDAQFNLAVMSQTGRGVPRNLPEAYKWYLVAASQGDSGARQAADALKAELSPDQQSAAERAAAAFRTQVATAQVKAAAAN